MKGYVIDVKKKSIELIEDTTSMPKPVEYNLYIVYRKIKTVKGREIKTAFSTPIQLDPDEVKELRRIGLEVISLKELKEQEQEM